MHLLLKILVFNKVSLIRGLVFKRMLYMSEAMNCTEVQVCTIYLISNAY